jgi:prepilin-type N-terminal cleavage/methylation domain-containing protein
MSRERGHGELGFTLLELLIALAIVGALLAVAFGGVRVGLAAWRQGEERAEAHQHVRGVALTLARAIGGTYPYRASRSLAPDPVLLFDGKADRLEFVTQSAPFPLGAPIAFTAVGVSLETSDPPGLVIRERALPNQEPFDKAKVVFSDPRVTGLEFSFLDKDGNWQDSWEGAALGATPIAIRIRVEIESSGRREALPPLTVSLRSTVQ